MTHSQRQHVTQDLYRITKEVLRGAEFLKDRLEYDICIIEQRIKDYKLQGQNVSLANALGPMKRDIKSDFYTENSFNL